MAVTTCGGAGTCGHMDTCLDTLCEGHPEQLRWPTRRVDFDSAVLDTRFGNGGHVVDGEDGERIRWDEPIATPDQAGRWTVYLVAIVCATAAAAAWVPALISTGGLAK